MSKQFAEGQVWTYKTRPNEQDSRITVVRVDADDPEFGNIIHIYVSSLDIPNASAAGGRTTFVNHMPYEEEALKAAVLDLQSNDQPLPEGFEDGYRLWREAFENSEAGVFNIPVSDAIEFVQASISGQ